MFVKQLNIVEQTCMLFVNHPNIHVPKTLINYDNIPFVYAMFTMNPLKFGLGNPRLTLCCLDLSTWLVDFQIVQIACHKLQWSRLCNMLRIIYMARHCCPAIDVLNMVKHYPRILQISPRLHSCNQLHSIPKFVN
jgi:hypothetical protein